MDTSDKKRILSLIRQNICTIRKQKGLSQQMLASMCDFEKSNMSRIEAGRSNVTIFTLSKIAKALNISLSDIVSIEDE